MLATLRYTPVCTLTGTPALSLAMTLTRFPRGAVVGVVYKNGCVRFPSAYAPPNPYGNFDAGRYGLLYNNVRKLVTPIPAKGAQGYWNWTPVAPLVYEG
jgi:hypothetical protein